MYFDILFYFVLPKTKRLKKVKKQTNKKKTCAIKTVVVTSLKRPAWSILD